ncbi:MAG: class B sortase [Lachnospiraceae bacterium]|nr:class B sortase [Lachnospiraceae bacterium]MCI9676511.1 class B sortase [Lachnospiraceae bacterium]
MEQKVFVVEGRQFRTKGDYARAVHDKELIDKLRKETDLQDKAQLEKLKADLKKGTYRFMTLLEQDFRDEVDELIRNAGAGKKTSGKKGSRNAKQQGAGKSGLSPGGIDASKQSQGEPEIDDAVKEELQKRERRRKLIIAACSVAAVCCLGYFGIYTYYDYRTNSTYEALSDLRLNRLPTTAAPAPAATPQFTLDETAPEPKEVLEEFKTLLNKNQKLIGWLKIDDTNIDYPVMQTSDNEYYLDHNLNQEYDKNGSIFMDKDCDVLQPSTNFILYGHHMKSGQMFGNLDRYSSEAYYKEHPYIQFDTIYERGTYQVMYVFRSHVYSEEEIAFKYYQFIDVNSEKEFDSYMQEMAAMSYYDTGVTAEYGDQLLTLSTCDYQEKDGRFVVVAKKIAKE